MVAFITSLFILTKYCSKIKDVVNSLSDVAQFELLDRLKILYQKGSGSAGFSHYPSMIVPLVEYFFTLTYDTGKSNLYQLLTNASLLPMFCGL